MDGVEPDDERYPDAPLPQHERQWRHPSEIGDATWRRTEPPLTIGRGLLVTTGAVGGLLALAVLWAMLPTATGGGEAVSTSAVRSTRSAVSSVRSADSSNGNPATFAATTRAPTTTPTTARSTTSALAPVTTDTARGATSEETDPPESSTEATATSLPDDATTGPSSTAATAPNATFSVTGGDVPSMAIAVAVGGVPIVLTTASAVRNAADTVTLSFDDGSTAPARVALTVNGIALLTTDGAAAAATTKLAGTPHDGDQVTLLGTSPATVALHVDGDGRLQLQSWGDGDVAEGTPVLNDQGRLIALCSKGSDGPKLVTIDQRTLRSALDTTTGSTAAKPAKPYLGVYLNADPTGSLTINAVEPDGPAAAAGIVAGDTVVSLDGEALASSDDLGEALAAHVPDDVVTVGVRRADGSETTVDLTLAVSPTRA